LHPDILEQQSGAFVALITFDLATSGQRNVPRQTINNALNPALRMTSQFKAGLDQFKPALFDFDGLG
jgi:hypothetical protein